MTKRIFDLFVSCVALILVSPLLLIISILILIDSGPSVLYRQIRVGRNSTTFRILKFRTMVAGADKFGSLTVSGDSRITRVGRFLRRYKLDELPQLLNVVLGDMSMVGPRPEVPEFVQCYSNEDKAIILSVRPGITDNASIEFKNESALLDDAINPKSHYIEQILPIKLSRYRSYVANRTIGMDIVILLKTVRAIW